MGRAREGRVARIDEEEEDCLAHIFHSTLLSGNLRQAVCQATNQQGGGYLIPGDVCTKTRRMDADFLQDKKTFMCVTPMGNPTCLEFEEYVKVPEAVPLDFS